MYHNWSTVNENKSRKKPLHVHGSDGLNLFLNGKSFVHQPLDFYFRLFQDGMYQPAQQDRLDLVATPGLSIGLAEHMTIKRTNFSHHPICLSQWPFNVKLNCITWLTRVCYVLWHDQTLSPLFNFPLSASTLAAISITTDSQKPLTISSTSW